MKDENDLSDAEIRRMWEDGRLVELAPGPPQRLTTRTVTRRCGHMSASGPGLKLTCGVCGPARVMT
jgi:hypothetical protein